MKPRGYLLLIFIMYAILPVAYGETINPRQYGLDKAANGVEACQVLQRCHADAVRKGATVSYKGIDTLKIEIPQGFTSIPLTEKVDFAGVTIIIENKTKDCYLFAKNSSLAEVNILGSEIDSGNFKRNKNLQSGHFLLIIEDAEPWCGRNGYVSKVKRKDAMIVKGGISSNLPISSYSSPVSKPQGWYRSIDSHKKTIRNLIFVRTQNSTYNTNCLKIENQYNIELKNITIQTPEDSVKYGDKAIHIENCVDVVLNDITINGTYSQLREYGYGISLFNIANLKVYRMYGRGNWGVFGTHCLNNVMLTNCDINRFDIHCYGRDVRAKGCMFNDLYNQFSSMYGAITFNKCEFKNFIPLLIESSYNAYTPFDVVWENCTFHLDKKNNYIMTLFGVPEPYNSRLELRRKCLPNITIQNSRVVLADDVDKWYLIQTGGVKYQDSFDYISSVNIDVDVYGKAGVKYDFSTEPLKTTNRINIKEIIKISSNE